MVTDIHTLLQGLQPYNVLGGAHSGSAQFLHYNLNSSQGFTSNPHVTANQLLSHYHTTPTPHTHILPAAHLAKLSYFTDPHSHTSLPHLTPYDLPAAHLAALSYLTGPHSHTSLLHLTLTPHDSPTFCTDFSCSTAMSGILECIIRANKFSKRWADLRRSEGGDSYCGSNVMFSL